MLIRTGLQLLMFPFCCVRMLFVCWNFKCYLNITTFDLRALLSNALIAQRAIILLFFAPLIIISMQLKLLVCGFELFFNIWNSLICPSANTLYIRNFYSKLYVYALFCYKDLQNIFIKKAGFLQSRKTCFNIFYFN